MEDALQRRGHAEMPSTVAERPTPRKVEKMKGRVNKQRLYPRSAWLEYFHDISLIYQHRVGSVLYSTNKFDGGMIFFPIIRLIKVYPKSWIEIYQPMLHANHCIHYSPLYYVNPLKS